MAEEELQNQTMNQKKILFANSGHVDTVMAILRDALPKEPLVGDTEFETLRNAITLDAQSNLIMEFINQVDYIKSGGLLNTE
jgi:hypothetical protein